MGCTICEGVQFENITFRNCVFENVEFINCKFLSVRFLECEFKGKCKFKAKSEYKRTELGNVEFWDCTFCDLQILGVDFKYDIKFNHCNFGNSLFVGLFLEESNDYVSTRFGYCESSKIEFYYCTFRDQLDFRPEIGENVELNFSHSKFERPERVEFRNVNFSRASFLYVRGLEKTKFVGVRWGISKYMWIFKRYSLCDEGLYRDGNIEKILEKIGEKLEEEEHKKLQQEKEICEATPIHTGSLEQLTSQA